MGVWWLFPAYYYGCAFIGVCMLGWNWGCRMTLIPHDTQSWNTLNEFLCVFISLCCLILNDYISMSNYINKKFHVITHKADNFPLILSHGYGLATTFRSFISNTVYFSEFGMLLQFNSDFRGKCVFLEVLCMGQHYRPISRFVKLHAFATYNAPINLFTLLLWSWILARSYDNGHRAW